MSSTNVAESAIKRPASPIANGATNAAEIAAIDEVGDTISKRGPGALK